MRINLKDFGGFLSSPELGKRIAISVLDSIRKEPENNVILDFSGVPGVNKHFCEEFLTLIFRGIGYEMFKKKVIMQNQTAVVKLVFDTVVSQKKEILPEGINSVIGEPIHTIYTEKKEERLDSAPKVLEPLKEKTIKDKEVVKKEEVVDVVNNVEPTQEAETVKEVQLYKGEVEEGIEEENKEEVVKARKIEERAKAQKKRGIKPKTTAKRVTKSKTTSRKFVSTTKKPKSATKKVVERKKK